MDSQFDTDCEYCGLLPEEGAIITSVLKDGEQVWLCQYCKADPILGSCGHHRTCDCLAGLD